MVGYDGPAITKPLPLGVAVIVICTVFPFLATVSVGLRFYARRVNAIRLKADDWIILPALFFTISTCVCGIIAAVGGHVGGHDDMTLLSQEIVWAKAIYALQIVYICALPLIKFSILLFYNRLFPSRRFRLVSYCIAAFVLCWWLVFFLTTVFQCTPISANWMVNPGDVYCIDEYVMYDVYSSLNLVTDVVILAMPWPLVMKLQLATRKKVQLLGIFLLGSFICVSGIIHLVYVIMLATAWSWKDETHYQAYIVIWFSLEPCTGIICACLPTLPALFKSPNPYRASVSSPRSTLLGSTSKTTKSSPPHSPSSWPADPWSLERKIRQDSYSDDYSAFTGSPVTGNV
ncbi:MAG: hypothetical protein FRX48_02087 [Lasallia pustulata]|uniref:Rhodopsin domain-containing protein n=1 Tax=Lasallia pustulata TaxID=136370 RepID=A0A5M8PXD9_9LECA|nr:MAG: hypothetical protein FRX48_02087 [Lasallia pustulata]